MRTSLIAAFFLQSVTCLVWSSYSLHSFISLPLFGEVIQMCLYDSLKVMAALVFHDAKTLLDQRQDCVSIILQYIVQLLTCLDFWPDLLNLSSVLILSYQLYTYTSPSLFKQKQFCSSGSSPLCRLQSQCSLQ